ncbi:hypothetical protein BH23ACT4_BH23ACT4_02810 [soil metagenome]
MSERARSGAILVGLALSAFALALAPLLMPDSYSWMVNTTSESAAQGVSGAWLARFGLGAFGLAVLVIAWSHPSWPPVARSAHIGFGVLMTVTAVASTRPWVAGISFRVVEDQIHSFAATGMGFAFAIGILAVVLGERRSGRLIRLSDVIAIVASVVIPLSMAALPERAGVLQRAMFIVAYFWYAVAARELTQGFRQSARNPPRPSPAIPEL